MEWSLVFGLWSLVLRSLILIETSAFCFLPSAFCLLSPVSCLLSPVSCLHLHNLLSQIFSREQSEESTWRVFEAFGNCLGILKLSFG